VLLAAALVGALAVQVARSFDFAAQPEEDAAILMRYSRHVAAGQGIVWNVGEPPVDGATDFLFMLLLAALHAAGLRLETAVRAIDLVAHALTVVIVYAGARRLFGASPAGAAVSAAFVAAGPALAYTSACFGTPLFALTVAVAWCAAARAVHDSGRGPTAAFAASALVMGLARPEGALLAVFMLMAVLYARDGEGARRTLGVFAALFGGLGLAYFTWRFWYFGHPLPTPFYKKGGGALHWDTFRKSFRNVWDLTFPFLLAWPVGLAFSRTRRQAVASLIPVVSFAAIWVLLSDETNYLKRFRYPIVPIVLMSWPPLVEGLRALLPRPGRRAAGVAAVVVACAFLVRHQRAFAPSQRPRAGLQDMAAMLRGFGAGRYAMAVTESGLLPLYSEWRAVDAWGLNDTWIARNGGITEDYLDRYRPEVVMFHAYYSPLEPPGPRAARSGLGPAWFRMCRTLQAYAERRGYRLAAAFGREPSHVHAYFVRPGFPDSAPIEAAIRGFDYVWYQDGQPSVNFAAESATRDTHTRAPGDDRKTMLP
jgi:arabinofuranosyltransferase